MMMTWDYAVPLILNYGLPFVLSVLQKWQSSPNVTPQDIEDLQKLADQNAQSQLLAAAARAGRPLDDPLVQALLKMLPPPPPAAPVPPNPT